MLTARHAARCQACNTLLDDLRVGQGCPRCGLPAGVDCAELRSVNPPAIAVLVVGITLFLVAARGEPIGRWEPQVLLVLSGCLLVTWRILVFYTTRFVCWRDGLIVVQQGEPVQQVAWHEISAVRWDGNHDRVVFFDTAGNERLVLGRQRLGSVRRARLLLALVCDWHARGEAHAGADRSVDDGAG